MQPRLGAPANGAYTVNVDVKYMKHPVQVGCSMPYTSI